ncbi:hypothetical protein QTI66_34750 [Variovorax sp. J22R133]|uniref:hypothetical protein n=1 Tax=Variovorax brevis TaxID=3053503 RepID=UPI002576E9AA|nr:hypothetical protein [Variovorax sp. J22R133]MDM0117280.1 hypothetical protein [Variovorax sp. J22R133]
MKLPFLPALSRRTRLALWAIALAVLAGNMGGELFGFFDYSEDVATACLVVLALLVLTPVDRTRRTVWIARKLHTNDGPRRWVEVRCDEAQHLKREPGWQVRRLVVVDDTVVEEHAE